jgi:ATP-dependent Clp protease ATP-binding subunit ClpC
MPELRTARAHQVMDRAAHEARALNHDYVGTEHLLLGLAESDSVALDTLNIDGVAAIGRVHDIIGPGEHPAQDEAPRLTPRATKVMALARDEAGLLGHDHVDAEHLLLAMIREADGVAGRVLASMGANLESARAAFAAA